MADRVNWMWYIPLLFSHNSITYSLMSSVYRCCCIRNTFHYKYTAIKHILYVYLLRFKFNQPVFELITQKTDTTDHSHTKLLLTHTHTLALRFWKNLFLFDGRSLEPLLTRFLSISSILVFDMGVPVPVQIYAPYAVVVGAACYFVNECVCSMIIAHFNCQTVGANQINRFACTLSFGLFWIFK